MFVFWLRCDLSPMQAAADWSKLQQLCVTKVSAHKRLSAEQRVQELSCSMASKESAEEFVSKLEQVANSGEVECEGVEAGCFKVVSIAIACIESGDAVSAENLSCKLQEAVARGVFSCQKVVKEACNIVIKFAKLASLGRRVMEDHPDVPAFCDADKDDAMARQLLRRWREANAALLEKVPEHLALEKGPLKKVCDEAWAVVVEIVKHRQSVIDQQIQQKTKVLDDISLGVAGGKSWKAGLQSGGDAHFDEVVKAAKVLWLPNAGKTLSAAWSALKQDCRAFLNCFVAVNAACCFVWEFLRETILKPDLALRGAVPAAYL